MIAFVPCKATALLIASLATVGWTRRAASAAIASTSCFMPASTEMSPPGFLARSRVQGLWPLLAAFREPMVAKPAVVPAIPMEVTPGGAKSPSE